MERIADAWKRGARFVRENPQLLYTIFLLVAIPLAFFFASEQFVRVARETQDKLERSRVGLLGDVFAEFARSHMDDPPYLGARIAALSVENETIDGFRVVGEEVPEGYPVVVSKDHQEVGTYFIPERLDSFLIGSARGNMRQSFAAEEYKGGVRHWRVVRAIARADGAGVAGYFIADVSMAEADRIARANIVRAYVILVLVIFALLVLLGRQARIVDYATLYRRLKEVDRMKDDFVSMAAHELRSPLAVIRAYAAELNEEKDISEKGKNFLGRIDGAAQSLNTLVGDILDVARLQEGRMSFAIAPTEPSAIIVAVAEGFEALANDKKLAFTYDKDPLPAVAIDPDRFRQIMVNVIGNAVKYTPSGSIRVTAKEREGRIEIRVSDTGIGISAEEQQRLFQKFYRVKSEETRTISGTGLGLWITAQIVEQMRGSIGVESIKGKGTDFIISFPVVG